MKVAVALFVGLFVELFVAGSRPAAADELAAPRGPDRAGPPAAAGLLPAAPEPAAAGEVDELGMSYDAYAASIDYEPTYADAVAQG